MFFKSFYQKKNSRHKTFSFFLSLLALLLFLILPITIVIVTQQEKQQHKIQAAGEDLFGISWGAGVPSLSEMQDMKNNLHVQWLRADCSWSDVQAEGATSWDWTNCDAIVNNAVAVGIKPLIVLAYTPAWARSSACSNDDKCEPANTDDFVRFAQAAATRYAGKVQAYEIWNEENGSTFWKPAPNPAKYTTMLIQSYTAIKSVDPNASVLNGGFAAFYTQNGNYSSIDFLKQMYANGVKGHFDFLATHPYCYADGFNCPVDEADWSNWSEMFWLTKSKTSTTGNLICSADPCNLHAIMVANEDVKKIVASEFGSPSGGSPTRNQTEQLYEINNSFTKFQSYKDNSGTSLTAMFFWYNYKDQCSNNSDTECFFGLTDYYGNHKPSYDAYAALANISSATPTPTPLPVTSKVIKLSEKGTKASTPTKVTYTLKTVKTITVDRLIVACRDSNGTNYDFPTVPNATLKGTQTRSSQRRLPAGTYTYWIAYYVNNTWYNLPPTKSFTLR